MEFLVAGVGILCVYTSGVFRGATNKDEICLPSLLFWLGSVIVLALVAFK